MQGCRRRSQLVFLQEDAGPWNASLTAGTRSFASLWGCEDPLEAAQDLPAVQSLADSDQPYQLSAQVFSTMIPCHTHKFIYLLHLITHTSDGCPCHPMGMGTIPPSLGMGTPSARGSDLWGQYPASMAQHFSCIQEDEASQIRGTPKLPGMDRTLPPWEGQHHRQKRRRRQIQRAVGRKSLPCRLFLVCFSSSGATDLCWCQCCD